MKGIFLFPEAAAKDPGVTEWMKEHSDELGKIAQYWFEVARASGSDVQEILHDGHPTACVDNAAFCYVNAFQKHVNVGFYKGSELEDPSGILEGEGKSMRHVKIRVQDFPFEKELKSLIEAAYRDMVRRCGSKP